MNKSGVCVGKSGVLEIKVVFVEESWCLRLTVVFF